MASFPTTCHFFQIGQLLNRLRGRRHGRDQTSPDFPVFFSRLAACFSFNVLEGFFLLSFLTFLSLPIISPPPFLLYLLMSGISIQEPSIFHNRNFLQTKEVDPHRRLW